MNPLNRYFLHSNCHWIEAWLTLTSILCEWCTCFCHSQNFTCKQKKIYSTCLLNAIHWWNIYLNISDATVIEKWKHFQFQIIVIVICCYDKWNNENFKCSICNNFNIRKNPPLLMIWCGSFFLYAYSVSLVNVIEV